MYYVIMSLLVHLLSFCCKSNFILGSDSNLPTNDSRAVLWLAERLNQNIISHNKYIKDGYIVVLLPTLLSWIKSGNLKYPRPTKIRQRKPKETEPEPIVSSP